MQRPQTESETAYLEHLLSGAPSTGLRAKEAIENFIVTAAASTLAAFVVWTGVAWLAAKLAGLEIGWFSDAFVRIAPVILAGTVIYSVWSTWRWMRGWPDHRQPIRDDLASGEVVEECLNVAEAMVFIEPNYGFLIYFLRIEDGRVMVHYDQESLDLALMDEEPTGSRFEPLRRMTIVTAPISGITIEKSFSGESVDVYGPYAMIDSPDPSPDDDNLYGVSWERLEETLRAG